jgi:hypothetical protein
VPLSFHQSRLPPTAMVHLLSCTTAASASYFSGAFAPFGHFLEVWEGGSQAAEDPIASTGCPSSAAAGFEVDRVGNRQRQGSRGEGGREGCCGQDKGAQHRCTLTVRSGLWPSTAFRRSCSIDLRILSPILLASKPFSCECRVPIDVAHTPYSTRTFATFAQSPSHSSTHIILHTRLTGWPRAMHTAPLMLEMSGFIFILESVWRRPRWTSRTVAPSWNFVFS